jgi:hypothetical protein
LNIGQEAAHAGSWIAQAVWFDDLSPGLPATGEWLELGDTAGTHLLTNPSRPDLANQWERWWYWVDGYTDGSHYHEYGIQQAPVGDGVLRTWIIQWDGSVSGWGIYECENGTCYKKNTDTLLWRDPTTMTKQELTLGSEVNYFGMNYNTNSNVFMAQNMWMREANGSWPGWSGNVQVQIDAGCSTYPTHFCLNGSWNAPAPPYTNWRNNKP